jgi:putative membrane-bound dehydrogenase-like protein
MNLLSRFALLLLGIVLPSLVIAQGNPANLGFELPPGFEISLYADDTLANDIHSLTIDAQGRVVVASRGYIKILHDTDGDGRADKATLFSKLPKSGAHGMYFDGNDLICNGDGGVRRYADTAGAGRCDHISPVWVPTKNDGEHAANGIVRGPDGWYYMACGNDAGITRAHARGPGSPVKEPGAGTVVRFTAHGKQSEIVAHGFRNPYDLAFNARGDLFTVDSDGERIHHMPYYTPTRLYDVAQGMHHGWPLSGWQRGWARPACWPDNVERLVEIGRGSPTGVIVYRHRAFPKRYQGGVFSLCWTFGRVYFFPLESKGSSYASKLEVFMRTTGDVGFAPTDMAVGPAGDLFIAIGGRGTRGSVFRVRYTGPEKAAPLPADPLRAVLAADEPLSSWARARWVPAAKQLGAAAFAAAALDERLPETERIRAVEILTELYGGIPCATAKTLKGPPDLIARVLWSLSRGTPSAEAYLLLTQHTADSHPRIARAAWEALAAWPEKIGVAPDTDLAAGLQQRDRRARAAFLQTLSHSPETAAHLAQHIKASAAAPRDQLASLWVDPRQLTLHPRTYVASCLLALQPPVDAAARMEAVRLLQLALGDVVAEDTLDKTLVGYTAQKSTHLDATLRRSIAEEVARIFPTEDADLDREMARLLAMLHADVPDLPTRLASRWQKRSAPEDDIHYLLVLAQLGGEGCREVTRQTAAALNGIYTKLAAQGARPTDQVPAILEALCDHLLKRDPELARAIVADPGFGVPGHESYANRLPLAEKQAAARKLLAAVRKLDEEQARAAWGPDLVRLVSALPDEEALPLLRAEYSDPRLSDSIALILAGKRQPADRARFVEALASSQPRVVAAAADALRALGQKASSPAELGAAVRALHRVTATPTDAAARQAVAALLALWSGQKLDAAAAAAWLTQAYPKEAPALLGMTGAGSAAWKPRLAKVAWDAGDAQRGELVFQRKSCFRCHGDARRLGPDLTGAAQRFARDDLFVALIDPSKDIAPAYRPTTITTTAGKVYNGLLIYESPALTLLQTTPETTVRLPGSEVQLIQPSRTSFMPAGLLDDASDRDLADLYAYLKTLRKR